jgi:hypothetical protein
VHWSGKRREVRRSKRRKRRRVRSKSRRMRGMGPRRALNRTVGARTRRRKRRKKAILVARRRAKRKMARRRVKRRGLCRSRESKQRATVCMAKATGWRQQASQAPRNSSSEVGLRRLRDRVDVVVVVHVAEVVAAGVAAVRGEAVVVAAAVARITRSSVVPDAAACMFSFN